MDKLGLFPKAIKIKQFIVVAVDYFTKWVEFKVLMVITAKKIISFLWKNIICK
jgi:hypothetical protein